MLLALHQLDYLNYLLIVLVTLKSLPLSVPNLLLFLLNLGRSFLLLPLLFSRLLWGRKRIVICVGPLFTQILSSAQWWIELIEIDLPVLSAELFLLFLPFSLLHLGLPVWMLALLLWPIHLLGHEWLRINIQFSINYLRLANRLERI